MYFENLLERFLTSFPRNDNRDDILANLLMSQDDHVPKQLRNDVNFVYMTIECCPIQLDSFLNVKIESPKVLISKYDFL